MSSHRVLTSAVLLVLACNRSPAQVAKTTASGDRSRSVGHGLELAKAGRCAEALAILKRSLAQTADKDLKRNAGLAGVRCAMVGNQFDTAQDFLRLLNREFPNDAEVLYASVHTYSDLATRASQHLATSAPNSPQAHELNAESLEVQGKWSEAQKEYQLIMQRNPDTPGIHFRIGRLLLSEPNPPADAAEQAKKELEQELQLDPTNAGAEYVLGELARQSQQWDDAIRHFSRAAELDSGFGDAFLGWGVALISTQKFSEAVTPLENAVKLEPANPAAHYNLAIAYTRTGRKQESEREFAIHREMVEKNRPAEGEAGGQPAPTPQ
ncbi:MAG: tetratricopeptide repeat protein [Acidobacteria bacterium]|nr:tetratricopeptide repeat protein [Acidobacteriota bacterium]